jgi:hypothetical protein
MMTDNLDAYRVGKYAKQEVIRKSRKIDSSEAGLIEVRMFGMPCSFSDLRGQLAPEIIR